MGLSNTSSVPRLAWPFRPRITFLLVACAVSLSALWLFLWSYDEHIFREHGPMENFQLGCLLISMSFLAFTLMKAPEPAFRVLIVGFGLLHLTFIIHEFDPRHWQNHWINFFLRGEFRNGLLTTAWCAGAILFFLKARAVWPVFIQWLPSQSGTLMWISGFFWVLGSVFDKAKPLAGNNSIMAEEIMEANGALFLLMAVISLFRLLKRPPSIQEIPCLEPGKARVDHFA
jgi:hypothetical protein